jgi:HTH-type transcriptional regulator / antitoxin HipB
MPVNDLARDPKQIGNLIRAARRRKSLTQMQLGAMVGLKQGSISQIESGYASIKLHNLLAILSALNLELQISPRSTGDWSIEG